MRSNCIQKLIKRQRLLRKYRLTIKDRRDDLRLLAMAGSTLGDNEFRNHLLQERLRQIRAYGRIKKTLKIKSRILLALHNIVGHPVMEVLYIFGLRSAGNFVHNKVFKIKTHE